MADIHEPVPGSRSRTSTHDHQGEKGERLLLASQSHAAYVTHSLMMAGAVCGTTCDASGQVMHEARQVRNNVIPAPGHLKWQSQAHLLEHDDVRAVCFISFQ